MRPQARAANKRPEAPAAGKGDGEEDAAAEAVGVVDVAARKPWPRRLPPKVSPAVVRKNLRLPRLNLLQPSLLRKPPNRYLRPRLLRFRSRSEPHDRRKELWF